MKKITIEGMNCGHCSNAVKTILEELGGKNVEVSHETGIATADIDASDEAVTAAVSEEGFDVISIEEA